MHPYNQACIEIDSDALRHNVAYLKQKSHSAQLLAIVKANAYGHGIVEVANILKEVDGFGVSYLCEAIQLRKAGITQRIVLLQGCLSYEEYYQVAQYNLDTVIHHALQIEWLNQIPITASITVWLKVNTGMNRLGFSPTQATAVWSQLYNHSKVNTLILMSHLACANQPAHDMNQQQYDCFSKIVARVDARVRSLANSAALLTRRDMHYEWVRPGLALYGVLPDLSEKEGDKNVLKAVMTLKAKIIAIQHPSQGEKIGYHSRALIPSSRRIGVIACGYANGYPYNAPDGTPVLFKTRRLPLLGQVSMNMMTVDLHNCPDARVGDMITLWGQGLPVEEIAGITGRSSYELLCGVQTNTYQLSKKGVSYDE